MSNFSAHTRDEHVVVVAEIHNVARNSEASNKDAAPVVDDGLNLRGHISGRSSKKINAERFVGFGTDELHLLNHAVEAHG